MESRSPTARTWSARTRTSPPARSWSAPAGGSRPRRSGASRRSAGPGSRSAAGPWSACSRPGTRSCRSTRCRGGARSGTSTRYLCRAFCAERGCETRFYGIVRDEPGALRAVLETAAGECDAVLVSGGSSKDERDLGARTIAEVGEVLVHGIALAPGKPTIIGRVHATPAIGLPGHPASAFVVLLVVAGPLLAALSGDLTDRSRRVRARLAENVPSARGREDYVRVTVRDGEARPVFAKSGLLNSLVRADGLLRVPAGREGFETGDEVEVLLW